MLEHKDPEIARRKDLSPFPNFNLVERPYRTQRLKRPKEVGPYE